MNPSLERFHQAQASTTSGFDTALAEIRSGGKRGHWIWYIFPQIEGLGQSSTARAYALRDLEEACAYLRDPVLFARYRDITKAVAEKLGKGSKLEHLLGSPIDALKLVSSLTLFRAAANHLADSVHDQDDLKALAGLFNTVLQAASLQGYPPCGYTLSHLA